LIQVAPATTRTSEEAIRQPGGYAWWHLDLLDEDGNGLNLSWSFGLPLLSGLRRGAAPPLSRPALTLAIHRGGAQAFSLVQELPPDEVDWRPESGYGLFGRSLIALQSDGSHLRLEIALDLELPRSPRLQGKIVAEGPIRFGGDDATGHSRHLWSPLLATCPGSARLDGALRYAMDGRSGLSHSAGLAPIHRLGVSRWDAGHVVMPRHDLMWLLHDGVRGQEGTALVLDVAEDGGARTAGGPFEILEFARSGWGLRRPQRWRIHDAEGRPVEISVRAVLESTAVFQRLLLTARSGDEQGVGVAELLAPRRLDRLWSRPLMALRVHRLFGRSSLLLPLFSGAAEGRLRRLLRPEAPSLTRGRG